MKKIRHVDTSGLPKGFDVSDLIASGVTGEDLKEWLRGRIKDGPPVMPRKPKKPNNPAQAAPKKPKQAKTAGADNVVPIAPVPAPTPEENADIPPEFSEDSLAMRFTQKHHKSLVYCGSWGRWLIWKDGKWEIDETGIAIDKARQVCRTAAVEAGERADLGAKRTAIANAISSRRCFSNVEQIGRTDRRHVAVPANFDADPWVLNTPAGIVNLKTGRMRKAKKEDWCIKSTAVGPGGECPTWIRFLKECTHDDSDLATYLQRVIGYCLSGSISEHVFFFCYGGGRNGKGTFMNVILWLLDTYTKVANMDTFTETRFARHSSEIAFFQGARLVTASETGAGQRWNESRIKSMTGGDPITANMMRENPFTFNPLFKLLFAGNFKPHLRNVDTAIKRRLFLVPFDYKVPEEKIDGHLPEKLRAEGPGILKWAIKGCLDWQGNSLNPPDRVIATTAEYFETEDKIGTFLEDCCEISIEHRTGTTIFYERYARWADQAGEYCGSRKDFLDMLATKGLRSIKRGGETVIDGVKIVVEADPPDDMWGGDRY